MFKLQKFKEKCEKNKKNRKKKEKINIKIKNRFKVNKSFLYVTSSLFNLFQFFYINIK